MLEAISQWFDGQWRAAGSCLVNLLGHPFASGMTISVLAIAVLLPLMLWTLVINLQQIHQAQPMREIQVFLHTKLTESDAQQLQANWLQQAEIRQVDITSPQQGLQWLQQQEGFGDIDRLLQTNPLPWVLNVLPEPIAPAQIEQLLRELRETQGVDLVQADNSWLEQLQRVLDFARHSLWLLAVLFAIAALLIISNTIRMDIENCRSEIEIMSLVGAAPRYIRRSFLYTGFLYGILAALLALSTLLACRWFLLPAAEQLLSGFRYSSELVLPAWMWLSASVLITGLLGWCGAFMSVERNLRRNLRSRT